MDTKENKNAVTSTVPFRDIVDVINTIPDEKCYKVRKEFDYFYGLEDGGEFEISFCSVNYMFSKISGHYPLNINDIPYSEIYVKNINLDSLVRIQKYSTSLTSSAHFNRYYFIWDSKFVQQYVPEKESHDFCADLRNMMKSVKVIDGLNIFGVMGGTILWMGRITGRKDNGDPILWCP